MRSSILIAVLATANLATGFVGQWLVLRLIGIGRETDALYAALGLPLAIFTLLATPVTAVMSPLLAGLSKEEARRQSSGMALLLLLASVPITVLLYGGAPLWTRLLLPGFEGPDQALVVELAQIHALALPLSAHHGVVWASVASRDRFVAGEASQAIVSVLSTVAIYPVALTWGVVGVAWLFSIRAGLRVVAMLPLSDVRPSFRLRGSGIRKVCSLTFPLALSTGYYSLGELLDRFLVSWAPPGALSLLNLATSLQTAGAGIVNRSVFARLAPKFGVLAKEARFSDLAHMAGRSSMFASGVGLASLLFVLLVGYPLLGLLVGRGGVDESNVRTLWSYTLALSGIVWGGATLQVYSQGLFALGESRRASIAVSVAYTIGLGLKLLGFLLLGVLGLALGTSLYYGLCTATTWRVFRKAVGERGLPPVRRSASGGTADASSAPVC